MASTSTEERVTGSTVSVPGDNKDRKAVAVNDEFLHEIRSIPGGEGVDLCIQCGTCTGSCPNANEMDYTPREMIAMIRAGMRDQVLSSNSMWHCASCYLCAARCPRGVKITDLMYVLKSVAWHDRKTGRGNRPVAMARSFVDILNRFGRVHEATMLALYYTRVNPLSAIPLAPVGIGLFTHHRLPLMPHQIKGKAQLQAIMRKAEELGGKS